jgi:ferritin-like metal-binding protein YciE
MGIFSKDIETFEQLFLHGLKDIYYAEQRIAETLPKLVEKATNRQLKQSLKQHLKETEEQIARLEQVFALLEETPKGTKCKGIEGLLGEGDELMGNIADQKVLDAAIITSAQAVEHYEITRYGALISWAGEMDRGELAKILSLTLKEEKATDKKLSSLAERKVNPKADGRSRTTARRTTASRSTARKPVARKKAAPKRVSP